MLVIEDNDDGRKSMALLLRLLGHEVVTAADGLEGLLRAMSWRPEAVIVDIGLPILDGYEVARRLRATLGANIVLIAHTAYSNPEDRRKGMEAGFDAYLVKPFDVNELSLWLSQTEVRQNLTNAN